MKKIVVVVGARPQFIKHAPVELALKTFFEVITVHTGQHYDKRMSDIFFNQLNINKPNYTLEVGSSTHGKQTGQMLEKIEGILINEKPDGVLVYGDTNSTLAGAIAASKLHIPIIHIEAGLRSFNKTMPEEVNRILTDHVSEILFAPTDTAVSNLKNEGISKNVFNVGDVMQDTILLAKKVIGENYRQNNQILLTIHRPYNTDNTERLITILQILNKLDIEIIFPVHPRTLNILNNVNVLLSDLKNIKFQEPASYFDLIRLQLESICIITDSGGVQKEAYMLERKCITLRSETEWIETLENGWNTLVYEDLDSIFNVLKSIPNIYKNNLYGDGQASLKMAELIKNYI